MDVYAITVVCLGVTAGHAPWMPLHFKNNIVLLHKKEKSTIKNLAVFNLANFNNSLNHRNNFYTKISSCTVCTYLYHLVLSITL